MVKDGVEDILQGYIEIMKAAGTDKGAGSFYAFAYAEGKKTAELYMKKYPDRYRINYVDDDIFEFYLESHSVPPNEDIPIITSPRERFLLYMRINGYESNDIMAMQKLFNGFRKGFQNEVKRIRLMRKRGQF